MRTKKTFFALSLFAALSFNAFGQSNVYPQVADDQLVIQGDKCGWDAGTVNIGAIMRLTIMRTMYICARLAS